jgi:Protein of Unknown function (DUF2784)
MSYSLLADGVVLLHLLFIVVAVLGGFLVLWRPWLAAIHLPAAAWAAYIEFAGGICPLTPLENRYRQLAGEGGYSGGFIEHYITPLIYPDGLTREIQVGLGLAVIAINVLAYGLLLRKLRRRV